MVLLIAKRTYGIIKIHFPPIKYFGYDNDEMNLLVQANHTYADN